MKRDSLVDPKVDIVFKRIFGCSEHPLPLLDLINAILEAFDEPILHNITVLNPALDPEHLTDKGAILDIKARSDDGEQANLEIQMVNPYHWQQRILYYWSRLFAEPLNKGDDYHTLRKTLSISLLNYPQFKRHRPYSLYELRERTDHQRLTDLLQMYFIELPRWQSGQGVPPHLSAWVNFFNVNSEADLLLLPTTNPAICEASDMLSTISHSPTERELYEMRRKALLDYNTNMRGAREEGIREGLKEGIETVALNLLQEGAEVAFIAKTTGLSTTDIERLRKSARKT